MAERVSPRIILQPSERRPALPAQAFADALDFAHRAQEIARGDFGERGFGEAAADQFGEEVREAADMFEAERLRAICLALPEATEAVIWHGPIFRAEDKIFALDRMVEDCLSLWFKAPAGRVRCGSLNRADS
jgi:hypothetical protein